MVSGGNNSLYGKCVFQKEWFLKENTTFKNRNMSFLIKRPSNTKTVKILAYCVLQVGTYEARARQKWPQMWIWWLLHFSHFWCPMGMFREYLPETLPQRTESEREKKTTTEVVVLSCRRTTRKVVVLPGAHRTAREVVVLPGAQDYQRSSCAAESTRLVEK